MSKIQVFALMREIFRTFHEGYEWKQARSLQEGAREELCSLLPLKHMRVPDKYGQGTLFGLKSP